MESPVRIYLGAAVVVNILLLTSTTVNGSALPHETNRTTITDENTTKYNRMNSTWSVNNKTPDVALNELHPKESASEEHTEKNAKYKDRGRVKFHSQLRSSTESTLRRIRSSTEPASLVIVTPKPDSKNSSQIDSMRTYKTKAPDLASSTSTSATMLFKAEKENQRSKDNDKEREEEEEEEEEEDDEDEKKIEKDEKEDEENDEKDEKEDDDKDEKEEEEEEEKENIDSFKKYTSSKFYGSNLFNIHDNDYKNNKHNQVKDDTSTPSFEKYSSYFSKDNYRSKESKNDDPYKSQSFFDFDSDLTTPKNNFFDQKYHEISTGIMKNLASMKGQSHLNDSSPQNIIKKNVGIEKFSNGSPNNKSMVIIKNTKEIRVLDNDQAGSANRELSDVHGTSIYYEMSVLSTETYNINHSSDDDCENETLPLETTARGTSQQVQDASFKATQPTIAQVPTKPVFSDLLPGSFSTLQPLLSVTPNSYNTITPMLKSGIPISTQTSIRFTDRPIKVNSSSFTRNRSYSKRLNLTGTKESPNSVTQQTDQTLNLGQRPLTRKFYYTTPKVKPIWMSPRRNVTKAYKTTYPTTIYAEHFNIKDKFSTTSRPSSHQKTILTTVPSDIDPVLQSDVGGVKKVVHSQIISDNTIPSLWKRGSMKITTAMPSTEFETSVSDLEIPPTMTAWALASLRSPPPLSSSVVNVSGSSQKSVDENELQKVGEVLDKRETTTASTKTTTTSSTVSALSNDIISKNITDIDQNKLPWKPVASNVEVNYETVTKSERLPAESNILIQGNLKPSETIHLSQNITEASTGIVKDHQTTPSWILAMYDKDITTTEEMRQTEEETIQPVDTTKSTGFESITKLPSGVTTPTDENNEIVTEQPKAETTTDYEITTIRFSYVPTEDITETQTPISNEDWHPVIPTRTIATTFENNPITTYRPTFLTTTEEIKETTSVPIDTTPQLEISSQTLENATQQLSQTIEQSTTEQITTPQTTTLIPKIKDTTSVPIDTTPQLEISSQTLEIATQQQSQTIEQSTTEEITTPRMTTLIPTIESTTDYQETTLVDTTPATLIETEATTEEIKQNSEYHETVTHFAEKQTDSSSEENSDSNEVISQDTISKTSTYDTSTTTITTTMKTESTTVPITTTTQTTLPEIKEYEEIIVTTDRKVETTVYTTTEITTKSVNELEDLTSYADDVTTETSSQVLTDEAGSGAAIAIAVSTIGVIALVLLVGLLLVVRRRGRRGVYAQRCTPVSLDAYSLDSVSVGHRKGNHRLRASKRSYGNPAYDDEVTSHPMQYPALANFALDVESISAEFAEIPSVSVRPEEVPAGCEDKNRYSNVLPLPETRVPLRRIGNDPTTEYINANYVTGPGSIRNYYILCQAPMSNTVVDFWRMIWEQNSRVIVMLTEYMENGVEKCYEYLPPSEVSDNKRTFGDYQIILKKREQRDKYAISTVQLINTSTRSWRELTHLWYFWPAKGVPDDYDSVIDFLSEMRSYMKISQTAKEYDEEGVEVIYGDQSRSSYNNLSKLRSDDNPSWNGVNVYSPAKAEELLRRANNGTLGRMKAASDIEGVRPCVCVCATGAGRSAALVALDACARALAAGAADVPRAVRELRAQRPHALANRHHYIFLYKVLSEYGNKLMGVGVDTI